MLKNKRNFFVLFVLFLLLFVGGVFLWQENQKDVAELNKNLPEGVRVVKSLIGEEYSVVNKIDGYEFKVPKEWKGIEEIEYIPERTEEGYVWDSLELEGKEGFGRVVGVSRFKLEQTNISLEEWAKNSFEFSSLKNNLSKDKINEFEIIKTQEQVGTIGYIYFFKKDLKLYTITGGSEEFIQEIISNGKW